jgi:energy-coupling factor transport system permease protein
MSAMRPPVLLYRRLASPLHATRPAAGALWCAALGAAALMIEQPLALGALLVGVLCAGSLAGVGRQLTAALRTAAIVAVPIVAVNVLVSREGLTVFARLGDLGPFGQGDLTVEALVYGAAIALRVTILIVVSTLASLTVDPDEALRLVRRVSYRSALTASLATRMIPVLSADARRLAEAQRTRPGAAQGRSLRSTAGFVRALVGGSLDRAVDVAATLELRGFAAGTGRSSAARDRSWSRHDAAFAASALAVLALALVAGPFGAVPFAAYPEVHWGFAAALPAVCFALLLALLLPFADRRGIAP